MVNYAFQFLVLRDRRCLYLALVLDFGCLAYFKYRVFLASAAGVDLFTHNIVIPLGLSFYIFQLSAFLIDLARGRAQPPIRLRALRCSNCSSASSLPARSCAGDNSDRKCTRCSMASSRAVIA